MIGLFLKMSTQIVGTTQRSVATFNNLSTNPEI